MDTTSADLPSSEQYQRGFSWQTIGNVVTTQWISSTVQVFVIVVLLAAYLIAAHGWFTIYRGNEPVAPRPKDDTNDKWTLSDCYNYRWKAAVAWMKQTHDCYAASIHQQCRHNAHKKEQYKRCASEWILTKYPQDLKWTDDDKEWLQPALLRTFRLMPTAKDTSNGTTQ